MNKQRAGDNGKAGALIGDAGRLINAIQKRHTLRGLMWEDVPSVADFESFKKLTANLAEPELGLPRLDVGFRRRLAPRLADAAKTSRRRGDLNRGTAKQRT